MFKPLLLIALGGFLASSSYAIQLVIGENSLSSTIDIDRIRDSTSLSDPRMTQAASTNGSHSEAFYMKQNQSERFEFSLTQQLRYIGQDIAVGNNGSFSFELKEAAYYSVTGSNRWSGLTPEGASSSAQLIRDPLEQGSLYGESDWAVAQSGWHVFQGQTNEGNAFLYGPNAALLSPGKYKLYYQFGLSDTLTDHTNDNSMAGVFSFELIQPDLFDARRAIEAGIEFPIYDTGGGQRWFRSFIAHDGLDSAQSGRIAPNESSYIRSRVFGSGVLSFWWKISSAKSDGLTMKVDGNSIVRISGEVDWQQRFVRIDDGLHEIEWAYSKGTDLSAGADAAWLDQVAFNPEAEQAPYLDQTISFEPGNTGQVFDSGVKVIATASSFLPVKIELLSGPAMFYGDLLVPYRSGSVILRATQPGDNLFRPATLERTVIFNGGVNPAELAANTPELDVEVRGPFNHVIEALALEPGGGLIAVGYFNNVHGEERQNIARFNSDMTLDRNWKPSVYGRIYCAVVLGDSVYIGGDFARIDDQARRNLAKISLTTGKVDLNWNPDADGMIWSMAATEDKLLVGGAFAQIGNFRRSSGTAKLDPEGAGAVDPRWNPNLSGLVNAIALSGTNLFVTGSFIDSSGAAPGLAKIFLHGSGQQDSRWKVPMDVTGARTIAVTPTHVFVGGYFRTNATSAVGVAAFSAVDGRQLGTAFPDRLAYKLAVHDDLLYAGFWGYSLSDFPRLARFSIPTWQRDQTWHPPVDELPQAGLATRVGELVFRGEDLFVGGDFASVGASPGRGIGMITTLEGTPSVAATSTSKDQMSGPGIVISPDSADKLETSHFEISEVTHGVLYKVEPMTGSNIALTNGSIISLNEATHGLRFLPDTGFFGTGTFKVRASKTPFPEGVGGNYIVGAVAVLEKRLDQLISFRPIANTPFDVGSVVLSFENSSRLPVTFTIKGPAHLENENILRFDDVGEVTVTAFSEGNELYEPSARVGTFFNITRARQTIQFEPQFEIRIGSILSLNAHASSGLPVDFSIVSGPARIDADKVTFSGTGDVIIRASQAGNARYQPAEIDRIVHVRGQVQTISFIPAPPRPFSSGPVTLSALASSGLPVTFRLLSGTATLVNETLTPLSAGNVVIEASQAGNADFDSAAVRQTFIFSRTIQTIDFQPIPPLVAGAIHRLNATASSDLPIIFSADSASATLDGDLLTITHPGRVTIEARQPGNANYEPALARQVLEIPRLAQTIQFSPETNVLAGQNYLLSAEASSGLPVILAVTSGRAAITNRNFFALAAGTVILTARQSGDSNYLPAEISRSIAVSRQTQTILFAPPPDRRLNEEGLTVSARTSGGLPVTFTVLSGPANGPVGDLISFTASGTVRLRATNPGNELYEPVEQEYSFQILKKAQAIEFSLLADRRLTDPMPPLQGRASSGLPVEFAIVSGPATIAGDLMRATGAGTVTVQARQPGNENYDPAISVEQSFTILKGAQSITFPPVPPMRFKSAPVLLGAIASSGLSVQYGVRSGPAILSTNLLTPVGAGEVTVVAFQDGDSNYEAAQSIEQTVPVNKAPQIIEFDTPSDILLSNGALMLEAKATSGLIVRFLVLSGPAILRGNELTPIGAGSVIVRASQPGDSNYEPALEIDRSILLNSSAPVLHIGRDPNGLSFRWSTNFSSVVLQASPNLLPSQWLPVAAPKGTAGGEFVISTPLNPGHRFYRLASP